MGIIGRLFGGRDEGEAPRSMSDEQALRRYRYMLETAPPETIERVHAEAFARLTPEQRRKVLTDLKSALPPHEAAAAPTNPDDTAALARTATRAELRQPGTLERTMGGAPGTAWGGGLMSSFLAGFAGSMLAQQLFGGFGHPVADAPIDEHTSHDDQQEADDGADWSDDGGDFGGGDFDV